MIGLIRFILAVIVLINHDGMDAPISMGVCAVVVFFLISGYVMSYSFNKNFDGKNIKNFYIDRIWRIFPTYFVFLALYIFYYLIAHVTIHTEKFVGLLVNCLLFPLNFISLFPQTLSVMDFGIFIPQAWTLGTELQFYLLLPFLIMNRCLKDILFILSGFVFLLAVFGFINTDVWGYRELPGVLFIFILGSYLYDFHYSELYSANSKKILIGAYILLVLFGVFLSFTRYISYHYSFEVLLGLILGLPLLYAVSQVKERISFDKTLGDLSYPLYLSNFLVIAGVGGLLHLTGSGGILMTVIIALLTSYLISRFIDFPIQRYRKQLQQRNKDK